jgi:hypothetical protein
MEKQTREICNSCEFMGVCNAIPGGNFCRVRRRRVSKTVTWREFLQTLSNEDFARWVVEEAPLIVMDTLNPIETLAEWCKQPTKEGK